LTSLASTRRDRPRNMRNARSVLVSSEMDPNRNRQMNLSIKNVPDEVVQRLRQRAARRHRSLQGELLSIIEQAVHSEHELSPAELLAQVRDLGLHTSADSADIVRADRDRG
jgi:antitoxin FitA